jgi:signal transduction histidine kinase
VPLIEEADLMTAAVPRTARIERPLVWRIYIYATGAALICTITWWPTGGHLQFWPKWVWFPLATLGVAHAAIAQIWRRSRGRNRWLALHLLLAIITCATLSAIWALADPHDVFWPKYTTLFFFMTLLFHFVNSHPAFRRKNSDVERALVSRVDELTRTRRGALDVQTVELRRIERDLHDGAQARLVALSLKLGRAEERLREQPEAAALVREAHHDADLAIAELRELARGIAPPILADRGIVEAVRALGRRSGIAVAVRADVPRRPPPSVELAAYFIVAEALTNAVKHAGTPTHPATATVTLDLVGATLVVQIADDGPGGANALGSGLSGLAQRAAALDGSFSVGDLGSATPGGSVGGTVVRAELPCGF